MSELDDHLNPFRAVEKNYISSAVFLVDDLEQCRLIAAWKLIPVHWENEGPKPEGAQRIWEWLWEGCNYDADRLRDVAKVTKQTFERIWLSTVASRLIYPDGTISEVADSIVTRVAAEAAKKGGRR